MIYSTISQKVVDGFGGRLVDRLGVSHGRIDSILVKIGMWIQIRELFNFLSDSSPLRDGAKNDMALYSMIFQKCIGSEMFSWIRHYVAWQRYVLYRVPFLVLMMFHILFVFFSHTSELMKLLFVHFVESCC